MVRAEIIFDGEHVQLIHYKRDSQFSLLTFDIMHAKANGRSAFAGKLSEKLGLNLIGVVPKYPCWYPGEDMKQIAGMCRALMTGETIAYGASMGGYGALRWGKEFGASHALACSPQISIDPAYTGSADRRYSKFFQPDRHLDMQVEARHMPESTLVLYDSSVRARSLPCASLS